MEVPFVELNARLVPSEATATKRASWGLQSTLRQEFVSGVLFVQVAPVGEDIALFVPSEETARSIDKEGLQATLTHEFA